MLFGGYQHNIDKKGRVFIPSKLREELGTGFIICRGIYGKRCLCVYSAEEWDKLVAKIGTLPSAKSSAVKRFLYDGAFSIDFDTQGRILIPPVLREYANLQKDVVLVGVLSRVEIWDKDRWQENTYDEDEMDEIAEHMADLGFSI